MMLNYESTRKIALPLLTAPEWSNARRPAQERLDSIGRLAIEARNGNMHAAEFLVNFVMDMESGESLAMRQASRQLVGLVLDVRTPTAIFREIISQALQFCQAVDAINTHQRKLGQPGDYQVPASIEYLAMRVGHGGTAGPANGQVLSQTRAEASMEAQGEKAACSANASVSA
jgi:hypothetical protein